jgi:hypothetical protein
MDNNLLHLKNPVQRILCILSCTVVVFLLETISYAEKLSAQTLGIEINSLPDTVLINSNLEANFTIHNQSTDAQLGNLQIWFLNQTNDSIAAPLGGFNVNQFFAAEQPRDFNILIPVNYNFFRQGGNTVVIWPSFVGQPVSADSIIKEIYVLDPNNIKKPYENGQLYFFPNPAGAALSIKASPKAAIPEKIIIRDLSGRILLQCDYFENEGTMNIENLAAGIYLLELRLPEGKNFIQRIVKSSSE